VGRCRPLAAIGINTPLDLKRSHPWLSANGSALAPCVWRSSFAALRARIWSARRRTASRDNSARRRHKREKATIDHLVDQVYEPRPAAEDRKSSTTDDGLSIDPKKGGLPIF
jgi:hypothetical protein